MNDDKQHAVWRESIEKYGKEMQSIVCMEECSELIQAVSKCLRGKPDATDNLAEEMADVTICLHLLQEKCTASPTSRLIRGLPAKRSGNSRE